MNPHLQLLLSPVYDGALAPPIYLRLGRRIVFGVADLEAFEQSRRVAARE